MLLMEILADYKQIFGIMHLFGVVVGFGAAIVADFLFFRFVSNFKLSNSELHVMGLVSGLVWAGLSLILVSGFLLFLTDTELYLNSSKFLIKMFVVIVITINGSFLHFYVKPRLKMIDWKSKTPGEGRKIRKLAFAAGAISFNSWLLAMVLGSLKSIPLDIDAAVLFYVCFLLVLILISQCAEIFYSRYIIKNL